MSIVERIKQLMYDNELSAAAFADTIGVQRSSISHILSERNKPSLDFILKYFTPTLLYRRSGYLKEMNLKALP